MVLSVMKVILGIKFMMLMTNIESHAPFAKLIPSQSNGGNRACNFTDMKFGDYNLQYIINAQNVVLLKLAMTLAFGNI